MEVVESEKLEDEEELEVTFEDDVTWFRANVVVVWVDEDETGDWTVVPIKLLFLSFSYFSEIDYKKTKLLQSFFLRKYNAIYTIVNEVMDKCVMRIDRGYRNTFSSLIWLDSLGSVSY